MKLSKSTVSAAALAALFMLSGTAEIRAANGDCAVIVTGGIKPLASDCLGILQHAVSKTLCAPLDPCVCDADGSGAILASDALLCLNVAVGNPAFTLACDCGGVTTTSTSSTSVSVSTVSTNSTSSTTLLLQPALVAGDFPAVSPCLDRDTLPEDVGFLAVIANAVEADNLVNFSQFNTQGLPEICGLASSDNVLAPGDLDWDPSRDNVLTVCNGFEPNVADFFTNVSLGHGPDLCQSGNDGFTLSMPRAGTYRRDACIEHGANAYDVRTRVTVQGASADQTFSSLGIARGDLKACDGTTELLTQADAKTFLAASPRNVSFSIRSGSCTGGSSHLDVTAEIICVKKRATPCPPPDFPCF